MLCRDWQWMMMMMIAMAATMKMTEANWYCRGRLAMLAMWQTGSNMAGLKQHSRQVAT
jgi:hypothetical protein